MKDPLGKAETCASLLFILLYAVGALTGLPFLISALFHDFEFPLATAISGAAVGATFLLCHYVYIFLHMSRQEHLPPTLAVAAAYPTVRPFFRPLLFTYWFSLFSVAAITSVFVLWPDEDKKTDFSSQMTFHVVAYLYSYFSYGFALIALRAVSNDSEILKRAWHYRVLVTLGMFGMAWGILRLLNA